MDARQGVKRALIHSLLFKILPITAILMGLFFFPAGTIRYWQAWVYLAVILIPVLAILLRLFQADPLLLKRRLRSVEPDRRQQLVILLSAVLLFPAFFLPGYDVRLGWSRVPVLVVLAADMAILLSFYLHWRVLQENPYASSVIVYEDGQTVVSSGPYAVIRHPMYLGLIVTFLFTPLALGSYWGMIPSLGFILLMAVRSAAEERLLVQSLPGYTEYQQRVKFRLFPGIW